MYPNSFASRGLPVLLSLLPLAYLVRMCVVHHVDVPYWDEWALVPRLAHLKAGTLTFNDVWQQHNEHRPLVPIALMLLLARLSGWNMAWEIAVNVLLGAGIFAIFWAYLATAWSDRGGAPFWLLPPISLLVFSPVQWENWVWGWQMQALMCVFASLAGAFLVSRSAVRRGAFGAAIVCAVWATYCFAAGVLLWFVQPAGVWLAGGPGRLRRLAVWSVAGALTCASFFYDYHRPPQPSMLANFVSAGAIKTLLAYVLTYLGSPIAGYSQPAAAVAGALVLTLFALLAAALWRHHAEPVHLFPLLAGLQALGTAAVSGLGRAWIGLDQALSSRYTSFAIPLWCATGCLAVAWLRRPHAARRARWPAVVACVLLALTLRAASTSARIGVLTVNGRNESLRFARRGLIVGRSDALLLMLYPDVSVVRAYRAELLRLRLSVFRPTRYPTYPVPGPL